jgi:hypothetical protein
MNRPNPPSTGLFSAARRGAAPSLADLAAAARDRLSAWWTATRKDAARPEAPAPASSAADEPRATAAAGPGTSPAPSYAQRCRVGLLFVSSEAEVPAAQRAVTRLLARQGPNELNASDIVGLVVRPTLHADLPAATLTDTTPPDGLATLVASFGEAGRWTLCWLDLAGLDLRSSRHQQRERAQQLLATLPTPAGGQRPLRLIPALSRAEARSPYRSLLDTFGMGTPGVLLQRRALTLDPARAGAERAGDR